MEDGVSGARATGLASPSGRAGWGSSRALVAVLARARPEESVALAVLVAEQVRVDRSVERGIVQLQREVVAALFGALRPRRPDLGPAHIDPMGGGILVATVGFGDDPDAVGPDAQGDDLALILLADFLERTDVRHVTSPCCSRAHDHRSLDGDRQAGDDRRRTRARAGAERRMAAVRLSCLAR